MIVEEKVPLASFTTFALGGPAQYLIRVTSREEVRAAVAFSKEKALPFFVLGGGSNLLVSDEGYRGVVIKIDIRGIEQEDGTIIAGAGEEWDAFVARTVQEGLWGLENLSGIPGTVGAAPVQNIGAYGAELKDALAWVEALDTLSGEVQRLDKEGCRFGYRTSRFKEEAGRWVILRVAFALTIEGAPNTSYKDVSDCTDLSVEKMRERVLAIRKGKFPDLSQEGTAGSFFLNPVVSPQQAHSLTALYPELPQFVVGSGIKISLAWLLDNALKARGFSHGGARLFEKQPLVIVAARTAQSKDVYDLAEEIMAIVKNKFDISLEPEVRIIS